MKDEERAGRFWRNRKDTASQGEGRLVDAEHRIVAALHVVEDKLERARLLCNEAGICLDLGAYDRAAVHARRAHELLDECCAPGTNDPTDRLRVRVLSLAASGLLQAKQFAAARPLLEQALAHCQHCLSSESDESCRVLQLLGTLEKEAGSRHAAEDYYRRALTLAQRVWDPFSGEVATICHELALLAEGWEEGDLMQPFAERACEIRCSLFGSTHPLSAAAQTGWALTLEAAGEEKRAGEKFLYALAIFDRHYAAAQGERSILAELLRDYAICRAGAARYLVACGRTADAREFSSRACEVIRQVLGKRHPLTLHVEHEHRALLRAAPGGRAAIRAGNAWNWWRGLSFSR